MSEEWNHALLLGIYTSGSEKALCEAHLDELERLCDTYELGVVDKFALPIKKIDTATILGKGKLEDLKSEIADMGAKIVIFDDEILPRQQRNLEKFFGIPVIDRTELIIEVFAKSAHTKEASLQVELAKTRYQLPRLTRMWTHLSRQSGSGQLKGEGEKQIEIDKRLIKKRISQLEKEIKQVAAQRATQRHGRMRQAIPSFAIVGYTNAGKSTLLNALTHANILAEDKLFATLDTTTRKYTLPNHQEILLIDTVGFIRKIPHTLVAAFKSTLEETLFTDILLHLIDVSDPMCEEHADEAYKVLQELGALERPIITVLNKIDQVYDPAIIPKLKIHYTKTVAISALKHEGFDELMQHMIRELSSLRQEVHLRIPQSHYDLVSRVMREGRVIHHDYIDNDVLLHVEIPKSLESAVHPFLHAG